MESESEERWCFSYINHWALPVEHIPQSVKIVVYEGRPRKTNNNNKRNNAFSRWTAWKGFLYLDCTGSGCAGIWINCTAALMENGWRADPVIHVAVLPPPQDIFQCTVEKLNNKSSHPTTDRNKLRKCVLYSSNGNELDKYPKKVLHIGEYLQLWANGCHGPLLIVMSSWYNSFHSGGAWAQTTIKYF